MNVFLWIIAGLLAAAFLAAGLMKLTRKREQLVEMMPWVNDFTGAQVKGIGGLETLGATGLILPAATGIAPILTPLAALGLALVMTGAVVVHTRRGDGVGMAAPSIVLGLLALVVVWGRFGPYQF